MGLNITRGIQEQAAQRVVLYGVEGVGKTTLASEFPDPLFIDTEGSTRHLDVARLDPPSSWSMLMEQIRQVRSERPCSTLVIDTIDWAERLCIDHIIAQAESATVRSIEDFGWGAGYTKLVEEFGRFLDLLSSVARAGVNVVLVAHADVRRFDTPEEAVSYDRWELKLSKSGQKKVSPLVKEWADAVLFLNFETIVETVASGPKQVKGKARGGTKRVMHTQHSACWDAKNRWGLAERLPLEYAGIAAHIPSAPASEAAAAIAGTASGSSAPIAGAAPAATESGRADQVVSATALSEAEEADRELKRIMSDMGGGGGSGDPDSTDPELPSYWDPLLQLLDASGATLEEFREYAVRKKHLTEGTALENYPRDYIEKVVSGWDTVRKNIEDNRGVPFTV